MDSSYGQRYAQLYREHWWWRARRELLLRELRALCPAERGLNILDVGSGDGLFFDDLREFGQAWGVESDSTLLSEGSRHRERIHIGPFDQSYQPERSFDLILMLDVLEHMTEREAALERVRQLLKPGGLLILTVPAFQVLWTQHDILNEHKLRFTRGTLLPLVTSAGLEVLHSRYFFHWLFALKLGVRLGEFCLRSKPASPKLPPSFLNQLAFHFSRAEEACFRRLGLPLGASLLVSCRLRE